jgi:peptidoglycan/LPS O-acetylase OafA/YrhL
MAVPFNGQANSIENEAFRYALAVVLAAMSFYCLERPFLKLKDKYSKNHA